LDCQGKGEGDVVMSALQGAKDDGMDIINLSLVMCMEPFFVLRVRL
jgi:hypothetical protein